MPIFGERNQPQGAVVVLRWQKPRDGPQASEEGVLQMLGVVVPPGHTLFTISCPDGG